MTFRQGGDFGGASAGGGGRGGTIMAGGGLGSILLIGLYLLLGGDPGDLQQPSPSGGQEGQQSPGGANDVNERCKTAEDGNNDDECRVLFTSRNVDEKWSHILPEQAGIEYTPPGRVIFQGQTQSGCGYASGSTGPFYCPSDESAYFDTAFFDSLRQFGAEDAPLAQMYIVAHEFGHHVQQLEGTLSLSNYNDPGADSNAVKIELQADCYAGIWAHHATQGPDSERDLEPITQDQLSSALQAARAVGDDNIQRRSGGEVRPDQWTHGSSEDREKAFMTGYETGQMASCDTLNRGAYKNS